MNVELAVRLRWRLESRESGCLEWTGPVNRYGYGSIFSDGKKVLAHRAAWSIACGDIPAGKMVCHSCDNRRCCNVAHLFLGTNLENTADKVSKGRQARGALCRNGMSKRNEESTKRIIESFHSGKTQKEIAAEHGISVSLVSLVVRGLRRA